MKTLVKLENYQLNRGEQTLIQGAHWRLKEGERVVISGPSGCGKSTLLAALAGLLPPSEGSLTGATLNIDSLGLLFQNPYAQLICPNLDDELAFSLENLEWSQPEMRSRITELKFQLNLKGLEHRAPWLYSGGEAQRASLGSALASRPPLLLLDEPLSYLDVQARRDFLKLIANLPLGSSWVVVDHEPWVWKDFATKHYQWNLQTGLKAAPFPTRPGRGHPDPFHEEFLGSPLLRAHQLQFAYKNQPPLFTGLNLRLARGETLALVGPSGCGKTTLFQILCGQIKPKSGQIYFNERPMKPHWLEKGIFTWVPQIPEHFFLHETVQEEWESAEDRELVPILIHQFGLEHLALRHPFSLSEGEKRRLGLIVAFAQKRPILLLDEPQYGLDSQATEFLIKLIREFQDRRQSMIIITHDPEFAAETAHRVFSLEGGS